MIIGIDAKTLSKRYTGIAVYVHDMITWFNKIAPQNKYILFSKSDFKMPKEWSSCEKVIVPSKLPGTFVVCFGLNHLLEQYHIDLFWGPEHCVPFKDTGIKRIVTFHDLGVIIEPAWGTTYNAILQRFLIRRTAHCVDYIVGISESTCKDVKEYCQLDSEKIRCIYDGDSPYTGKQPSVTEKKTEAILQKLQIDKSYFLYFGTIEPRKNIDTIVKAYGHYRENTKDRKNIKLVLAGGLGWKYKGILKEIEHSRYKNDIIRTGYVDETEKEVLYRNAVALLFPSLYEGFGLPILEGMSCGIPVITARNSSLPEVGGDVAYYIEEAKDDKKLADTMEMVASLTESERIEKGKQGIARAKMFSRKKCAEQLLDLFDEVVR